MSREQSPLFWIKDLYLILRTLIFNATTAGGLGQLIFRRAALHRFRVGSVQAVQLGFTVHWRFMQGFLNDNNLHSNLNPV